MGPGASSGPSPFHVHATCVAYQRRGVLLTGPSGSGKSALGLKLMALGARLVADDQTILQARDGVLLASCPPAICGMIEARGVGLLSCEPEVEVPLVLAVDLAQVETERLPPERHVSYLGCVITLFHNPGHDHFSSAILQYLKGGRRA